MAEPSAEIRCLQDCINGLVGLLALPALWEGAAPALVLRTVLEVLARLLDLELAYARWNDGPLPLELARSERDPEVTTRAREIGGRLAPALKQQWPGLAYSVPHPFGAGDLRVTHLWLGMDKESGFLLAGSRRPGFPTTTEMLLLRVAANQVAAEFQRVQLSAARQRADSAERLNDEIQARNAYLHQETERFWGDLVGGSKALEATQALAERVAPTNACVLVQGETGTGKELVARAVHELSPRREHPFVRLNCAAIPASLLEAELFGHEKGAFTGAVARRIGRFELADGGTLFLDEVGEIPLELQAKLLRVIQEREFERLGSNRTLRVDVRLVAATNRDLEQMVADRVFRDDLYYRLKVFPIRVPALRERVEDIPVLARHFMRLHARAHERAVRAIAPEALAVLCRYPWPGNVRELSHFIERCVILSRGETLEIPDGELRSRAVHDASDASLEAVAREHILRALDECNWVLGGPGGAAARLGMKRTSLQYKMQRLGVTRR
ncbi:sigma 54-interacting transcriptional regulator [Ramlibacter ginsenosidimutans]|uniref:Sigma 54-interacting transcriptional regulator n=1 Tax=Ramlibacter ginsenosidimutans TaxID=502333 RepID=A0A934WL73_9BURK|nr:sigma 54-interacting transcriptional regulator [Ramlibacter ginsenosidimutans]MBK6004802.1 sigma 54-interacting transcriptional regulator [Ramlibacter ginsenosidimutans]